MYLWQEAQPDTGTQTSASDWRRQIIKLVSSDRHNTLYTPFDPPLMGWRVLIRKHVWWTTRSRTKGIAVYCAAH